MSIASEITRLQGVKADILTAIGNKGVTVPAGSALVDCPDLIASIKTEGPDLSGYTIYDYFIKNGNNRAYNIMWSGTSFCDALSLLLSESMSTHRYSLKMSFVLDNSTIPSSWADIISTYQPGDGQNAYMEMQQQNDVLTLRFVLAYTSQFNKPTATYSVALSGPYTRLDIVASNEKMVVNGVDCAWSSTGKPLKGERYVIVPYSNQASEYVGSRFEYIAILDNDKVISEIVPAKNNANGHLGWLDVKSAEFYDNTEYNCWDVPACVAGISLCIVEVNSSSGDVVTATNSGTTIQSDIGRCFFSLPISGTWTFECNNVSKSVAIADNEYKYISFEESIVYQNGTQGISLINGQNCTFDTDYISFTPGTGDYCAFVRTQNQITGINPKRIRGKFVRDSVEYTFDEELTEAISGKYLYITFQSTASYNAICVGYDSNIVTPAPTTAEQIQLDYSTNAASNIRLKELYLY